MMAGKLESSFEHSVICHQSLTLFVPLGRSSFLFSSLLFLSSFSSLLFSSLLFSFSLTSFFLLTSLWLLHVFFFFLNCVWFVSDFYKSSGSACPRCSSFSLCVCCVCVCFWPICFCFIFCVSLSFVIVLFSSLSSFVLSCFYSSACSSLRLRLLLLLFCSDHALFIFLSSLSHARSFAHRYRIALLV